MINNQKWFNQILNDDISVDHRLSNTSKIEKISARAGNPKSLKRDIGISIGLGFVFTFLFGLMLSLFFNDKKKDIIYTYFKDSKFYTVKVTPLNDSTVKLKEQSDKFEIKHSIDELNKYPIIKWNIIKKTATIQDYIMFSIIVVLIISFWIFIYNSDLKKKIIQYLPNMLSNLIELKSRKIKHREVQNSEL